MTPKPQKFNDYSVQGPFKLGDVVHMEGASAILGDVTEIEDDDGDQLVTVAWRATTTTEQEFELWLKERTP